MGLPQRWVNIIVWNVKFELNPSKKWRSPSNMFLYLAILEPFLNGTGFLHRCLERIVLFRGSCLLETLVISIGEVKRAGWVILLEISTLLFGCRAMNWLRVHVLWHTRVKNLGLLRVSGRRQDLVFRPILMVSFACKLHTYLKQLLFRLIYHFMSIYVLHVRSLSILCFIPKCATIEVFLNLGYLK